MFTFLKRIFANLQKKESSENIFEEQIKRNMYDYEYVRKIGDCTRYVREHFLDENYPRFLAYIEEFLKKYNFEGLQEFDFDVTPEDLVLLGENEAYKSEEAYIIDEKCRVTVKTPLFCAITKTRHLPNRKRIIPMVLESWEVLDFNPESFNDEYIDAFEKYFNTIKKYLTGLNSAEPAVLKFHPSFFPLLCENFDEFFEIQEFMENGTQEHFLVLSTLGGKLLLTSNKVNKHIDTLNTKMLNRLTKS